MSELELLKQDCRMKLMVVGRAELRRWLAQEDDEWDLQMAEDEASGKLDFLLKKADEDSKAGRCKEILNILITSVCSIGRDRCETEHPKSKSFRAPDAVGDSLSEFCAINDLERALEFGRAVYARAISCFDEELSRTWNGPDLFQITLKPVLLAFASEPAQEATLPSPIR